MRSWVSKRSNSSTSPRAIPPRAGLSARVIQGEPCRSFAAPFHLAIDAQDWIWVSNSGIDHVTRFSAADTSKAENFKSGFNTSGLAIDSQGNDPFYCCRFGNSLVGMMHLVHMGVRLKLYGVTKASDYLTKTMSEQKGGRQGGSMILLRHGRLPLSRFSVHRRNSAGAMGRRRGWR